MQKINADLSMLPPTAFPKMIKSLVIFFIGLMTACSHIDEETPRSFVRLIAADTVELRKEITARLEKNGNNVLFDAHPLALVQKPGLSATSVDFGWVTQHGVIIAYNKNLSVVTIFEPVFYNGKVTWTCAIYPDRAKPKECGNWHE